MINQFVTLAFRLLLAWILKTDIHPQFPISRERPLYLPVLLLKSRSCRVVNKLHLISETICFLNTAGSPRQCVPLLLPQPALHAAP